MATGWSRSGMLSMKSALERRRVDGVLCLPEPPSGCPGAPLFAGRRWKIGRLLALSKRG
jgi:hypothetical protein